MRRKLTPWVGSLLISAVIWGLFWVWFGAPAVRGTDFPVAGNLEDPTITNPEMADSLEAWLAATKQCMGGERGPELTISTGGISPTNHYHSVDTQGGASSDDLDTINWNYVREGHVLVLLAASPIHTVVVRDHELGGGNIRLQGDSFTLDDVYGAITLIRKGTWFYQVASSYSTPTAELTAIGGFSDEGGTIIGDVHIGSSGDMHRLYVHQTGQSAIVIARLDAGIDSEILLGPSGIFSRNSGATSPLRLQDAGGAVYVGGSTSANLVWTKANDGVDSGLDADLLDGQTGSYYTDTGTGIASYCGCRDSGYDGGQLASGTWTERPIEPGVAGTQARWRTTFTTGTHGSSINGLYIQLTAGKYMIEASASAYRVNAHQVSVNNATDGVRKTGGTNEYAGAGDTVGSRSFAMAEVVIAATELFNLTHYVQTSNGDEDGGRPVSFPALDETYELFKVTKIN